MRWASASAGVVTLVLACGGTAGPTPVPLPGNTATAVADYITGLATAALTADAAREAGDSLYAPGAEIVASGEHRSGPPRYAGIGDGGQVVVSASRVDVSGRFAWALLEYRWLAPDRNLLHQGRATFIFQLQPDRRHWLIVHAHSSSAH